MKFIEVIIRPNMYYQTKRKLIEKGFNSAFTYDVLGRGKKPAEFELAADGTPSTTGIEFCSKKYMGIYAINEEVDTIVEIIKNVNSTGCPGDGKIFVSDVEGAIRISTEQLGEDAII